MRNKIKMVKRGKIQSRKNRFVSDYTNIYLKTEWFISK